MFTRAFRLFVSSTFKDFSQERELLQNRVFPALDQYCAARGYQFHAIDLRWGVSEEAQLDQRTAEICLAEVAAAKAYPAPNFFVMLGGRYGWVPLPFAIAQDEFEALLQTLDKRRETSAVCDAQHVYRLDENHMMPCGLLPVSSSTSTACTSAYVLCSRTDEINDLKDAAAWEAVERRLRKALQAAANHLLNSGRIDNAGYAKYVMSLTEQEIVRALRHEGPAAASNLDRLAADRPHAIAWIRERAGPIHATIRDRLRRRLGLLSRGATMALPDIEPEATTLTAWLKQAIAEDCIVTRKAVTLADGKFDQGYLDGFVATVQAKLEEAVERQIAAAELVERQPDHALCIERGEHRHFAEERQALFIGQEYHRAVIATYVTGSSAEVFQRPRFRNVALMVRARQDAREVGRHPLVLFGRSGLGKSALMARVAVDAEKSTYGMTVIYRFIGVTAASSDLRSLLVSIAADLAARGIVTKPARWESDPDKFNVQVRELLLSAVRPVTLFIDALDKIRHPIRLDWLPEVLPRNLKIIVSVLHDESFVDDSAAYRLLRQRLPTQTFIEAKALNTSQGRDILLALEKNAKRSLRSAQRNYVLRRFETSGGSPLYLKVAFEIARTWRSWDEAGQGRFVLAGDTNSLFGQLIDELSIVHHHEPALIRRSFGLIAAAKDGLSAKELTAVLACDEEVMEEIAANAAKHGVEPISIQRQGRREPKLPDSVWVRLHHRLTSLLNERRIDDQLLLSFFHRQLAGIAADRCYVSSEVRLHKALATYFDAHSIETEGVGVSPCTIYPRRTLSELPHQLFKAGDRGRLDEILLMPDWMQQKLQEFGVHALVDDYQYAHTRAQKLIGQTLELVADTLMRDSGQFVPQLLGRIRADTTVGIEDLRRIDEMRRIARTLARAPALLPRWAQFSVPGGPEMRRIKTKYQRVNAVAYSTDGKHILCASNELLIWEIARRSWSPLESSVATEAVAFSHDGRCFASAVGDSVHIWDIASGTSHTLKGHSSKVRAIAFSPDDSHIVSGSDDCTVRVWDLSTGVSRVFEGHRASVRSVGYSSSGQQIVSGSIDHTIRLWAASSGDFSLLEGHRGAVRSVAFSSDGRHIASGSDDRTVRIWDLSTGLSRVLEGHHAGVNTVTFTAADEQLLTGSDDSTLRSWEVFSGTSRELGYHGGPVRSIAVSPDGRYAVSGSEDYTLRFWELSSAISSPREWHRSDVTAVAFSPDGQYVVSGSTDQTLRLWETSKGAARALIGHDGIVTAVAFLRDSRHVVSTSADHTLRIWDIVSGKSRALRGHSGAVKALAISPDGHHAASGSDDCTVRLWNLSTGTSKQLIGHEAQIRTVGFSPDARLVLSSSDDRTLRVWDVAGGASQTLAGHYGAVDAAAFFPDGCQIVSGSRSSDLRLWNTATGTSREIRGLNGGVQSVAVSSDGSHFIAASFGTMLLWDLATGASRTLQGHGDRITSLAFTPDGAHIASSSRDGTLRLWNVASGEEIARLDGDFAFTVASPAPDGRSLAAGDIAGRVHLIDIHLDEI